MTCPFGPNVRVQGFVVVGDGLFWAGGAAPPCAFAAKNCPPCVVANPAVLVVFAGGA
jgi:hypothetical protein